MLTATDPTVQPVLDAFAKLRVQNVRVIDRLAGSLGVVPSDYRALFFVADHDDATPKAVADFLGLTTGAMTTLVDRIEAAGLVARSAHPTDRRSIRLEVTPKGQKAVDFGRAKYNDAFADAIPVEHRELIAELFASLADELRQVGDEVEAAS